MQPKLKPDCLLAKSYALGHWKGSYSLVGHTADVVNAVTTLVDTLGDRLITQFGLTCTFEHLRDTARLAAYLHDWGKANDHFQCTLRGKIPGAAPRHFYPEYKQMYRHEVVSMLLAWEFRSWLQKANGDFLAALVAAGGHHQKLGGEKGRATHELGKYREQSGYMEMHLYFLHKDFKNLFTYGIEKLGLPPGVKKAVGQLPAQVWKINDFTIKRKKLKAILKTYQGSPTLIAVLKALLISGDCFASAAPQTDLKDGNKIVGYQTWVRRQLEKTLDSKKLDQIIQHRLEGKKPYYFQEKLGEVENRVVIARAGCGTGKTVGAYNWAKKHAIGRKLFFCYPTTGTSTEGFLDYVHGQVAASLIHSRSQVDLEIMTTNDGSELEENLDAALRLSSFEAWSTESIICTVDTVLGLLRCNRRPLLCFPAIANAAFVFDEVHCYDAELFGTLLRFLQVIKAPVLLMSASVLPWQKTAIETAVGETVEIIEGEKKLEILDRYRFHMLDQPDWERVEQELNANGKVLWVCNQVNTAINIYEEAQQRGFNALLYHSRYRYEDRLKHHRDVVDAFKPDQKKPVIAVCTQVAEMSLDLSATLLVSQIADPAGLIQRLGRLNRKYCGHALDTLFYPDTKEGFPYKKEQLANGLKMIESFVGDVKQSDLANWLEKYTPEPRDFEETSVVWLDGEWRTYPQPLREAGHNVTAILEQDLGRLKNMSSQLQAKEIPKLTIPILASSLQKTSKSQAPEKFKKKYVIAPADIWGYCQEKGAFELKKRGGDAT